MVWQYIPNLSQRLIEITTKIKNNGKFKWSNKDKETICSIMEIISEKTKLNFAHFKKHFELETDASDLAIGAVLKHK